MYTARYIKKTITTCVLCSMVIIAAAQSKKLTCLELRSGIFHNYSKNGKEHFVCRREEEYQYETNLTRGDSVVWKINWVDDCTYTLKYISGTGVADDATMKILKKHKLAYEVTKLSDNYYVYKGYLDNTSGTLFESDTMWVSEKAIVTNNELFEQLPNESLLRKQHFGDTSKYAVVYIYRPGKFTNSIGNYLIYCNDNVMCAVKNRSGYIFKIFKEGKVSFRSKLLKDESAVTVDIKFGKTYYVKSMIHWAITSRLYNFRLEMATVTQEKGAEEFEKVDSD